MLLALLLVAGAVTWLLIAQPWRGFALESLLPTPSATATSRAPTPTAVPTPTETVDASPEPSPDTTGTAKPCEARELLVEAVTDQESYDAGQLPQLSIRLTNSGTKDCTINVGTTSQKFTISSGSDVWWRSTDCQTEPSDMIVTLAAGQTVTSATPLAWDRTRSSVSSCEDAGRPQAPGGGASYHLSVEIGGVPSEGSAQFFLY